MEKSDFCSFIYLVTMTLLVHYSVFVGYIHRLTAVGLFATFTNSLSVQNNPNKLSLSRVVTLSTYIATSK